MAAGYISLALAKSRVKVLKRKSHDNAWISPEFMGKELRRCIAPIQIWEDYVSDEVKSITSPL
jgi:hypothetical protein